MSNISLHNEPASHIDFFDEDNSQHRLAALAALLLCGAEEARLRRIDRRHKTRFYLCRPELLPNPRFDTPWQQLYNSQNDRAYITTMGFDVATFQFILESGFAEQWDSTPILRSDTNSNGAPRTGGRSLDAAGGLGLYLHWICSTMRETSLQQIFALVPATVTRYLAFAQAILLEQLRKLRDGEIKWPEELEEYERLSALVQARHRLLLGAFGSIDGLNLPVQVSADCEVENSTYNGWLHGHFRSCVIVFASDGVIRHAVLNAPGSWHDSRVARPIYEQLRDRTPEGFYLVADTAFPRGTREVEGRIRTALKEGERLPDDLQERDQRLAYDRELLSYRQTAEWGMRAVQGVFGRLRIPLEANDDEGRANLLETCMRLANVRTRRVGINQIRNVYIPIWQGEDDHLYNDMEALLYGEAQTGYVDRVARFHAT